MLATCSLASANSTTRRRTISIILSWHFETLVNVVILGNLAFLIHDANVRAAGEEVDEFLLEHVTQP